MDWKKITGNKYFIIGAIILVVAIIVLIIKKIPKSDSYTRESGNSYKQSQLSYSNLEYRNMAERLYDAMNRDGTDEETIFQIVGRMYNADDWYKLVESFGIKKSTRNFFNQSFEGNLMEWLVSEFDSDEQKELATILERIGVQF